MELREELHKAFERCAQQDRANAAETAALQATLAGYQQHLTSFTDRQTNFELVIAELLSWAKAQGYAGSDLSGASSAQE